MHNEGHRIDGLLQRSGNVYGANEYLANRKVIETIAVEVRRSFSLGAKKLLPDNEKSDGKELPWRLYSDIPSEI